MEQEPGIPVNPSNWKNGTVVALKSHFYTESVSSDVIVYSGEPKLISPLMVITETIPEKKAYHPATGKLIDDDKVKYQCKCIWFSTKTFQFEETTISSGLLNIIKLAEEQDEFNYGDLVQLRSSEIELGKKKTSLKTRNNKFENTIAGELSFVSPVMQVISIQKNEIKEPLRDINTQRAKRYISKRLVKCKYYNSVSEKMSEVLIPIDALCQVKNVTNEELKQIAEAIKNNFHLIQNEEEAKKQLVNPKKIIYRSGKYYLSGYDYYTAKIEEFDLSKQGFRILEDLDIDHLPNFGGEGSKFKAKLITPGHVTDFIKTYKDKLLWITYVDFNDIETKRIIGLPELLVDIEKNEIDGTKKETYYLKAFCHLRNDIRHFKLRGIKTIKVLNI